MARSGRNRQSKREVPEELRRMRASLTEEKRLELFRQTFDRHPEDDDELERFIRQLTMELYNEGHNEV